MVIRKRRLWLLKIQTQKPWWQQGQNDDIVWSKEFDVKPTNLLLCMALTEVDKMIGAWSLMPDLLCTLDKMDLVILTGAINDDDTPLPEGKRVVSKLEQKWVFRNKRDMKDGTIIKEQSTTDGCSKVHFYTDFTEEVYVKQPPGFEDPAHPNKSSMVKDFEELMQKEFKMSSMGELTFFLGLQVKQTTAGIFLSQDKYVKDILNKFDFRTIKPASTPIEAHKSLGKDEEGEDVDVHLYRSMIGCLMYLTASRPDIMFAVCLCARFQVTPKVSHMHAVKRIFRYLKHQPKLGLWYPKDSPFHLEAFSDSDYAGDNHDRRSTSGGCQYLGRRLVSWQCKKQTIVAISSTEAEYVAAASCCAQVLWMQNQLLDYGFNFMNTEIHIDNESTICIVKNPVLHSKTKHIQIRHHFIRDCYEQRLINVVKVHTDDNVADLLTKGFDLARFNFLVVTIGMMNP
ncbi:putative ribonuclease H-like domain-containing protein [Tanacetum coccineum]